MDTVSNEVLIEENLRRREVFFAPYDPLDGTGSPMPRFPLPFTKDQVIYLPESMSGEPVVQRALAAGSLKELFDSTVNSIKETEKAVAGFVNLRIQHDFEFWGATCARITNKDGEIVPFVLNYPQRKLLFELEAMRLSGVPIRIVLLKARQWGGSTLLRLYMGFLQLFIKTGWGSAIVASVEGQATHIRGMFDVVAHNHPPSVLPIKLIPYRGSSKNREIAGRGCVVGVGSYEEPDSLRGFTFQMLHFSEVAFWHPTIKKTPEKLVQSMKSSVPRKPHTLIALESTAKGVGNFFHREWVKAERGESGYKPVFVPFFEIEDYQLKIAREDYPAFIETMDEREYQMWEMGATLESLLWYRTFMAEENYSREAMNEEYPASAHEAFVSTGRRVFPHKYTMKLRESCMEPEAKGELRGKTITGPESLEGIEFHEQPGGNLWVWTPPDNSIEVANRYVVFVDIGGRTKKANKSVIRVLDRFWMIDGGKPEFVATWRGNIDQDILAWIAAQVASWYNDALLIIEDNSLDKDDDGAGHFFTVLDEIAKHYDNLYSRTDPDKIKEGAPIKYGFSTNRKTKPMIIDALLAAARDNDYIERDARAVDEMDTFEEKDNKRLGAQEGCYDDMVVTSAGCVWAGVKDMDKPYVVKRDSRKTSRRKIVGEASI